MATFLSRLKSTSTYPKNIASVTSNFTMASQLLLSAAISSDGQVQEAPYTLLCIAVAVERVNREILLPQSAEINGVSAIYQEESAVHPFERLLLAANEFSLHRTATLDKHGIKNRSRHLASSVEALNRLTQAETDLLRLLSSTPRLETKSRLAKQIEDLKKTKTRELTGVSLPRHLQIMTIEEDQLEFRRDMHGVALAWGRNVLGERYASRDKPLCFMYKHSAPEIFQRMKRVVRADLSTRNQRRIAALNAKERQRIMDLELQGILSPEQQLEAKLDRLFAGAAAT